MDPSGADHPLSSRRAMLRQQSVVLHGLQCRPEDLHLTPWYTEESTDSSTTALGEHGSYLSLSRSRNDTHAPVRPSLHSTKDSSAESESSGPKSIVPCMSRKAYMDLSDAIALLDETCPNPNASPPLTPAAARTPLTPRSRNHRARSKSSDNSSNYSNERLNDRSIDASGREREKRRPFLRKIGISKTEDRPFLAKIAPKIVGKPYLEKIGPSRAVERPFLEKIGSSKTLEKFSFDTLRDLPRAMIRRTHTIVEPVLMETPPAKTPCKDTEDAVLSSSDNRRSGKGPLIKMCSFETEDLDEDLIDSSEVVYVRTRRNALRESCLFDALDSSPSSLPLLENNNLTEDTAMSDVTLQPIFTGDAELLKCRVTTSEEIISSSSGDFGQTRGTISWGNSPQWPTKKHHPICQTPVYDSQEILSRNEEKVPNSPTKRKISQVFPTKEEQQLPRVATVKTQNSPLSRDLDASPTKTRRRQSSREPYENLSKVGKTESTTGSEELMASSKSRKQIFNDMIEKFGGPRRQVSEDILDKFDISREENYSRYGERRGISSDNLRSLRDIVVVGSAPSGSSLGYQSGGDSSFVSVQSSNNSQDILRGACKLLQNDYQFQDVPAESYAAFKRRTRPDFHTTLDRYRFVTRQTTTDTVQVPKFCNITREKARNDGETDRTLASDCSDVKARSGAVKAVLQKQEGIDTANDQEADLAGSLRRPMRKIFHEPSQETMDLLSELKKVKSMLQTPSEERYDWEFDSLKPVRVAKKISLFDKEFCLSVERENSIRRPSQLNIKAAEAEASCGNNDEKMCGLALFEKRCLSLDYADDVKPEKPDVRAISLVSATSPKSCTEDAPCVYDSKSCLSDVFTTPTEENFADSLSRSSPKSPRNNDDVDIAIPIDQPRSVSPKKRVQCHEWTSDLYEIISPRSTPFRVKKRLGRISVEESVKQESFAIDKVDNRSVVSQKKTKCFPL